VLRKKAESDNNANGSPSLQRRWLRPNISLLDDVGFIQTLLKNPQSIAGEGSFPEDSASVDHVQRIHNKHQVTWVNLEILTETIQHKYPTHMIHFTYFNIQDNNKKHPHSA
jgi:hypothetical protein